ncbi:hypothetical protein [Saccharothrix variisporea]|uniref:Uncharacterized protein n=1 Tax=Saccharothrix variisporea TaxID=543527 RepID=A0A495XCP8_9PSEU|nr:hypothetical protein [Saccharothrix variisporea]RKT69318.1 hypothetical protein DFJ66_2528 [Saccharothrix variisporea]
MRTVVGNGVVGVGVPDVLDELVGSAPWRVKLGRGNSVALHFGDVVPATEQSPERGAWMLWIPGAAWRLESADDVIAAWADDPDVARSVERLAGLEVRAVSVTTPGLELDVDFGEEVLRVFPLRADGDVEQWVLYTPSDAVLVAGPGANWRWEG